MMVSALNNSVADHNVESLAMPASAAGSSWSMAQVTELLSSTAEISNLVSVITVLLCMISMLVFLFNLIYQVNIQ